MDVKGSHGSVLADGDSGWSSRISKAKGPSQTLKRGAVFKNIRVDPDNPEEVKCRDGRSTRVLKTCFIKKA